MKSVTVNLNWIRHGFSCANRLRAIASEKKSYFDVAKGAYISDDPVLTDKGVEQAKKLNTFVKTNKSTFDALVCSNMKRTMETALYAFNGTSIKTLYVVPFISEMRPIYAFGLDKENIPLGSDHMEAYYKKLNETEKFSITVDFSILRYFEQNFKNIGPNYENFIKLALPQVIAKLPVKDTYSVAIASHHLFIKDHINKNPELEQKIADVNNTEMWKESVTIDIVPTVVSYSSNKLDCNDKMCDIGLQKVYSGAPTPTIKESGDVGRCKIHGEKYIAHDRKITGTSHQTGGSDLSNTYYHKYMKYKTKYIAYRK